MHLPPVGPNTRIPHGNQANYNPNAFVYYGQRSSRKDFAQGNVIYEF